MDDLEEQRQLIEPMLWQFIAWHQANPWELAMTQIPIKTYLDEVERPLVGFVDFGFMNGIDLDTKTRKSLQKEKDDIRQLAIYGKSRGRPQALLVATAKKHECYSIPQEELDAALKEVIASAKSLERFLSVMPNRETAITSLPANDHYTLDDAAKAKLAEIGV